MYFFILGLYLKVCIIGEMLLYNVNWLMVMEWGVEENLGYVKNGIFFEIEFGGFLNF